MPPGRKRKSSSKESGTPKKTRKVGRPPKTTTNKSTPRKTRKQTKLNEFGNGSSSQDLSNNINEEQESEEYLAVPPNTGIVPNWNTQVNHFELVNVSQDQLPEEEASIYFTTPPEENAKTPQNTSDLTSHDVNENIQMESSTSDTQQEQEQETPQNMETQEDSNITRQNNETNEKIPVVKLKRQMATWHDQQDLAVLFTTGPIWTFDWCPLDQENQYAALGCHKMDESTHIIGKAYAGDNRIAIWNMGPLNTDQTPRPSPKPVMYIEHQHGICWDLKWCPSIVSTKNPQFQEILGVLFAVFSDGALCAYVVPHPNIYDISEGKIIKIDLKPNVEIVDTEKLMWTLSWSHENRFLACGCQDGNIAIFRLTESGFNKSQVICAHTSAVRSISWSTQCPFHLFSVGNDGTFRLWDLRDPFYPLTTVTHGRAWITDSRWPSDSSGIMFCSSDGIIRQFAMKDRRMANAKTSEDTLWAMDLSSTQQLLISASAEGRIFVQSVDKNGVVIFGRKRHKFDLPVVNLRKNESQRDSFYIYSQEMNIGTFENQEKKKEKKSNTKNKNKSKNNKGKSKSKTVKNFPPIEEMFYVSKFHPSSKPKLKNWVFAGSAGSMGILFQMPSSILQRVK